MKKSLVLAMAMALGVTASAYAANPFSDVPAGHWAYDAVNKLAAEGVVDGYPDGTYGGDKLMTRYEMAQIVAKAMAKGANVDKLAAEFADELDSLGVRVANLEKKADNVKITGQIRASYRSVDGAASNHQGYLRTRLFLNGQINEDWAYTGRFENRQYYTDDTWGSNHNSDDDVDLNWAYVTGRVGGVKVEAGRQDFVMGDVVDNRGDGVKLSYGDQVKVLGWAYKASSSDWTNTANGYAADVADGVKDGDRVYVAGIESKFGVVGADLHYYNADTARDQEIWELALDGEIAKDLTLRGSYFYGDSDNDLVDGDDSGWLVGLSYRGAKASKPGSWGLYANYSDRPLATFLEPTLFAGGYAVFPGDTAAGDGYEGYDVGANVTLAKNIVFNVKYADMESREGSKDAQTLWTDVVFTF
ncbi:MAG: hypothetical protein DBY32_02180 [Phascolarctobacterium sp.]|nr:MAG: hypothetical protein DBY32_02180 [Phascolarctobacterium sp.]